MNIHPSLDSARIMDAIEEASRTLDNPGFCIQCGEDAGPLEPDAEYALCDCCGNNTCFGAEQLLLLTFGM
jgi:hypothetical protein